MSPQGETSPGQAVGSDPLQHVQVVAGGVGGVQHQFADAHPPVAHAAGVDEDEARVRRPAGHGDEEVMTGTGQEVARQ